MRLVTYNTSAALQHCGRFGSFELSAMPDANYLLSGVQHASHTSSSSPYASLDSNVCVVQACKQQRSHFINQVRLTSHSRHFVHSSTLTACAASVVSMLPCCHGCIGAAEACAGGGAMRFLWFTRPSPGTALTYIFKGVASPEHVGFAQMWSRATFAWLPQLLPCGVCTL